MKEHIVLLLYLSIHSLRYKWEKLCRRGNSPLITKSIICIKTSLISRIFLYSEHRFLRLYYVTSVITLMQQYRLVIFYTEN